MLDYHIHTNHSVDAEGTLRACCQQALTCGLREICITNHCELDPARSDSLIRLDNQDQPLTRASLLNLNEQALQEKQCFRTKGLEVRFGLEIGYFPGIEPRLKRITEGIDFDFLLGSIHCLDHICIDSSDEYQPYFDTHTVRELLNNYLEAVHDLVTSGCCDAIGHFDVYKKYGIQYYGNAIHMLLEDEMADIFRIMAEKEIALEINTAGLRRIHEFYPAPPIMKCARDNGITMVTIGSDAHKVEHVGLGIKQALEYAQSFGFDAVYGYRKRKPIEISI